MTGVTVNGRNWTDFDAGKEWVRVPAPKEKKPHATPAIRQQLQAAGMLGPKNRASFKADLAKDFAYWKSAIKKYGIVGE